MPHYFFDFFDGRSSERDKFGRNLDNVAAAEVIANGILSDFALRGGPHREISRSRVVIRDENGVVKEVWYVNEKR